MAVNLSPVGGVAAQFFDNDGNVLSGGLIYTYLAGTSTPAVTYTTAAGVIQHSNPIVLDSAGRVPTGEIWLTDGISYKFVLKDSGDALIATYDNIVGINSNFVNYTNQQEIQTATAGQTVFTLTTMSYQPGTHSLSVFVDGVNQYGPGAQYSYVETDSTTVTFNAGLHVGAEVKFTSTQQQGAGAVDSSQVTYDPPFTGSVATNVEAKLAQYVSVKDFGAVGDGVVDDTQAFVDALAAAASVHMPSGTYKITQTIDVPTGASLIGASSDGTKLSKIVFAPATPGSVLFRHQGADGINYANFAVEGPGNNTGTLESAFDMFTTVAAERQITFNQIVISEFDRAGVYMGGQWHITVNNCTFIDCGNRSLNLAYTGGIVLREDGGLPAWSGSGNVFQDNYFTGCSYGIYSESAWSVILLNNIYEYNSYPFLRNANGAVWTEIGGWMENNTNPEVIRGPMIRLGGRGTSMADHSVSFGTEGSVVFGNSGMAVYRTSSPNARIFPNGQVVADNGKVYVGTDGSAPFDACYFGGSVASGDFARIRNLAASGATSANMIRFLSAVDATVGLISSTGSATTYATSSDYRLKEDVKPLTGALQKVAALKPCTYKWKLDGSFGDGFIAHELAEVFPQAVVGEKDAVDENGKPSYQGIDTSFLIATLVAAIQEQQKMIDDLNSKIKKLLLLNLN